MHDWDSVICTVYLPCSAVSSDCLSRDENIHGEVTDVCSAPASACEFLEDRTRQHAAVLISSFYLVADKKNKLCIYV